MKITIFTFLTFFFLFSSSSVFAKVEISEIMYDLKTGSDNGREWIEVFNNSDQVVDFSNFRFFEADTNHKLILFQGGTEIAAQGYALIVADPIKFKNDWPNFSGTIFDSSFSLRNDGEALAIKDKNLNIIDQYIYSAQQGANGDGNSLQKVSGAWISAKPTPGAENKLPPRQSAGEGEIKTEKPVLEKAPIDKIVRQDLTIAPGHATAEENNFPYLFLISLIFLLGVGSGTVYFVRRKKKVAQAGEDFEILDE